MPTPDDVRNLRPSQPKHIHAFPKPLIFFSIPRPFVDPAAYLAPPLAAIFVRTAGDLGRDVDPVGGGAGGGC
jgi:hypothetical protein